MCLTAVNGPALTTGFVALGDVSGGCGCANTLVSNSISPAIKANETPKTLKMIAVYA
jgi:hypothetical protein